MEANLIETGICELASQFGVEWYACVHVKMELGTELGLQPGYPLECSLPGHKGVATGNSGSRGPHRSSLLDDLIEGLAPPLVCEHPVDVPPSLRKGAVVALPVAVPGYEEDQFAAHLALDAPLRVREVGRLCEIGYLREGHHSESASCFSAVLRSHSWNPESPDSSGWNERAIRLFVITPTTSLPNLAVT